MKELDARGLACPAPVLLTKRTLEDECPAAIEIVVDNEAAGENVSRFLSSQAYDASIIKEDNIFRIMGKKGAGVVTKVTPEPAADIDQQKIMVMVTTDRMGAGDDELGLKLMVNFLKTLPEMGSDLWRLVFVNAGVKMTIEGSETLEVLQQLEAEGLQILVCGTCLDHFHLLEKKQVGVTTNMLDIVMAMQFAEKVINI